MRRSLLATVTVSVALGALLSGSATAAGAPVDRAVQAGLYAGSVDKTWAATPVDYDGDGRQDVWVGYHQQGGKLYRNNGDGTYTWVARDAFGRVNQYGQVPDRHDCAFGDVDGDRRPDAYCSAGRNKSNYVKRNKGNQLWLQKTPGVFTEVAVQYGLQDICGRGRHVAMLDVNGDGWLDIFLGNEAGRATSDPCDDPANGLPNEESKIFLNQGGTGFAYAPSYGVGGANSGQRCAVVLDIDRNGRPDLFTCNLQNQKPYLYRNDGAAPLVDIAAQQRLTPVSDAVAADLNGDGWTDLVTAAKEGCAYRLNDRGTLRPRVLIAPSPSGATARAVAAGDADGSGSPDVYCQFGALTGSTNPDDVLLLNTAMAFSSAGPVPSSTGTADEVAALTPFPGGRTQFLTLEGRQVDGPVRLVAVP